MRHTLLLLSIALLIISCGGDTKKDQNPKITIGNSTTMETKESGVVNLALSGNDRMQFDKQEFTVNAGETIVLNFRHTGKMAKNIMGHNFVLLKSNVSIPEFSAQAATAGASKDWIPEGDQTLAHTKMLGGGETTSITFTAPAKGSYDFICSFPGHAALMKGKFIVK